MSKQQLDPEIYDDEAFVGMEEGELLDGKVVDDLNDEGEPACLLACCPYCVTYRLADAISFLCFELRLRRAGRWNRTHSAR